MASQRFRLPIASAAGGVPSVSSITYLQTAGATAGFVDVFLDNADIKSLAMLEMAIEHLKLYLRQNYRVSVGGV